MRPAAADLIDWAERALSIPGSEHRWDVAIEALITAHIVHNDIPSAVERGEFWLQVADDRRVPRHQLYRALVALAVALRNHGRAQEAAAIARELQRMGGPARNAGDVLLDTISRYNPEVHIPADGDGE